MLKEIFNYRNFTKLLIKVSPSFSGGAEVSSGRVCRGTEKCWGRSRTERRCQEVGWYKWPPRDTAYLHRCFLVSVTTDKKDGHATRSKDTDQNCLTHPQARNDFKIPVGLCAQSCLTLCDATDCSLLCSPVHRILQARYWSGLPIHSPGALPDSRIKPASLASPAG